MEKKLISDDVFFEDLYNSYKEEILNYCRRCLKGQCLYSAEDCMQITFLEAKKQINHLKQHPNIKGWLYTTSKNQINMLYRRLYNKRKHEIYFNEDEFENLGKLDDEIKKLFDLNIEVDLVVTIILNELNEQEYDLYKDYYKKDYSVSELAIKNNISYTAVTTRIYRLKKKLIKLISDFIKKL